MDTIDLQARPKRVFDVRARNLFGRRLLLRVHVTMETNEVGHFIWAQCGAGRTVADIAVAVAEEYQIDIDTARSDVTRFLRSLADAQFIEWELA